MLLETGGHLGSLFRALRGLLIGAAVRGRIPLDREAIDYELAMLRDEYLPITTADAVWMHELDRTGGMGLSVPRTAAGVPRCLDRQLLLRYGGDGSRYVMHPLVRGTVARMAERARP